MPTATSYERKGHPVSNAGFTLIEVIAALIIVSVLAAMIYPATSGQWRTAGGVGDCRALFELQGQMEKIVAAYKTELSEGDGNIDLAAFRETVLSDYDYVEAGSTNFLEASGSGLELTDTPAAETLLLVTLVKDDQRIATIFSGI